MFSVVNFNLFNITPKQMYELGNLVAIYLLVIGVGLYGLAYLVSALRGIAEVYGDREGEQFGPRDLYGPVAKLTASTIAIGIVLHTHWIWRSLSGGEYVTADWLDRPIGSFGDFALAVIAGSSEPIAQMMQYLMAASAIVLFAALAYILNITPASHEWLAAKWNQITERRAHAARTETVSES